ncbi:hypothetical protein [Brachybacterium sp.]|uniref:hypothetical protein n=1 Tax=Brachybacterium sp. TaxID=1891286 RepID=UPI002ED40659
MMRHAAGGHLTAGTGTHGTANQVTVLVLAAGALLASLVARSVLPERFLRDDHSVQLGMMPDKRYLVASSFQDIASIYQALGLQDLAPLAGLLSLGLFVVCLFAAVGWGRLRHAQLIDLAMIGASLGLAVVYLGQYSKELATIAITALLLLAPRGRRWDLVIALACLGYGATLRPYWLIIGCLFLAWRLALSLVHRPVWLLLFPVLSYVALQAAFAIVLGDGLQSQREGLNGTRPDADSVASLIVSPLPDAPGPAGVLAIILMVLLLLFPLPLLAIGSLYHLASAMLIAVFWLAVLVPVARGRITGPQEEAPSRPLVVAQRSAALLFSLLMVQALFEPDYGSYFKHLTPVLPLVLALLPVALRPLRRRTTAAAIHGTTPVPTGLPGLPSAPAATGPGSGPGSQPLGRIF